LTPPHLIFFVVNITQYPEVVFNAGISNSKSSSPTAAAAAATTTTRKLCYRKDDRAMRAI